MISLDELLKTLADGKYHSGTDLGEKFGISRAAIAKHIKKIEKNYGLSIFAVKGKGYRLQQSLELLDEEIIKQKITEKTAEQLKKLEIFFDIDSTNTYLSHKTIEGIPSGYLVLAEQQNKGLGRRGKSWNSPFGCNLYLSLLWRFQCGAAQLAGLSLFVAIAVVRALNHVGISDAGVKWPNDIYWRNKKLAGILLEMRGEFSGPSSVVVGIGLNISTPESNSDMENITQPWVDLETILAKKVKRNDFIAHVIDALFDVLNEIPEHKHKLFEEWQVMDILKGQDINVVFDDKVISGKALGVNKDGALKLLHQGKEILCHSGEVSVRRQ